MSAQGKRDVALQSCRHFSSNVYIIWKPVVLLSTACMLGALLHVQLRLHLDGNLPHCLPLLGQVSADYRLCRVCTGIGLSSPAIWQDERCFLGGRYGGLS